MHVVIVGAGAWGTALAGLVHDAGAEVTLVARNPKVAESLRVSRTHPRSLPSYVLPMAVRIEQDAVDTIVAIAPDLVIMAIPSAAVEDAARAVVRSGYDGAILTATKGIDSDSLQTPTERISRSIGTSQPVVALSGPNLALEIAAGLPAAAVVASRSSDAAMLARRALMSSRFRVYTTSDVVGVEVAGAYKNVIAIGAGIADGLQAGENAKAAFITRGVAEMARLGVACGANPLTFAGLAGIGDLMATCHSPSSRNYTVGRGLASGKSLEDVLAGMHEVAEGVPTTRASLALAAVRGVELPIAQQVARVLFKGVSTNEAIADLMARDATSELAFLEEMQAERG